MVVTSIIRTVRIVPSPVSKQAVVEYELNQPERVLVASPILKNSKSTTSDGVMVSVYWVTGFEDDEISGVLKITTPGGSTLPDEWIEYTHNEFKEAYPGLPIYS